MINDGSTDSSLEIIKNSKIDNLKIYSLDKNQGPAKPEIWELNFQRVNIYCF